ncbi:MAG: glutamate-5-semialdehyde dehydrogenase [Oscillospiraceae bacterium]|nr:glutamate-5-semialdehyde dehydrogenase [Oscillospiraceae bacterium]
MTTLDILKAAKASAPALAKADTELKNAALAAMADALEENCAHILEANAKDMEIAKDHLSVSMLDRLALNESRIRGMAEGIRQVTQLPDPVGQVRCRVERPNGIVIDRVGVAMGVIAMVYESRPNVTSDAAALAVKAGSACVLRSGKDAFCSANAIVDAMQAGLEKVGLPPLLVQLVQDTSRQSVTDLMEAVGYVDLLIPRGGAGLIKACTEGAKVPCIQTGTGICHIYVDKDADQEMALNIIENAKTSRPSVCNAAECCLVHKDIAKEFLPKLQKRLVQDRVANPVELRLDKTAAAIIPGKAAADTDFDTEFLDYILAVAVVEDGQQAIGHIALHSTGHSECIVTENEVLADLFTKVVDSAAVYVNCSTRFTDGGEFGLGCEIGISTQKLHARGPMGLDEICTYKYVIHGEGQCR